MIDKISIFTPQKVNPQMAENLQKITSTIREDAGIYIDKYLLKNLCVEVSERGTKIHGSLPKFKYGHNLYNLTCKETQEIISDIENQLCISLTDAKVYNFEFGVNCEVTHDPKCYMECLGNVPRLERKHINAQSEGDSLYYLPRRKEGKGEREIYFYDKIAEAIKSKVSIPSDLQNKNLLRYEIRFYKNLRKQLKIPFATVGTICQEEVYNICMEKLLSFYLGIEKISTQEQTEEYTTAKTPNQAFDIFLTNELSKVPTLQDDLRLFEKQLKRILKSTQRARIREKVRKYTTLRDIEKSPLLREFEEELHRVAQAALTRTHAQ